MDILSASEWKGWFDVAKTRLDVEQQEVIVSLREQLLELRAENIGLREELFELKRTRSIRSEFDFDGSVFFKKDDSDKKRPYCPKCLQGDDREVLLGIEKNYYRCSLCKFVHTHTPPQLHRSDSFNPYD